MAVIHRLKTRRERLSTSQAAALRQALMTVEGLPRNAVTAIITTIDQQTASISGWTFVMLSPRQNAMVVKWLSQNSRYPKLAPVLWAELFAHLRIDTGEVAVSRSELAELVACHPNDVTTIMAELESIGAISRRREPEPGVRGRIVRYYMNPKVGTHLAGRARDKAQAAAPCLKIV